MKLFQLVALPTTCYLPEAAYWIALGRIPEYLLTEDEEEARQSKERTQDGLIEDYDPFGFSAREFSCLGLDVDIRRYHEIRRVSFGNTGAEHIQWHNDMESRIAEFDYEAINPDYPNYMARNAIRVKAEALDADWARELEEPFAPIVDMARAQFFQALATGQLDAIGWKAFTPTEMLENDGDGPNDGDEGKFQKISQDYWTLRQLDWENSELKVKSGNFKAIKSNWINYLMCFPCL